MAIEGNYHLLETVSNGEFLKRELIQSPHRAIAQLLTLIDQLSIPRKFKASFSHGLSEEQLERFISAIKYADVFSAKNLAMDNSGQLPLSLDKALRFSNPMMALRWVETMCPMTWLDWALARPYPEVRLAMVKRGFFPKPIEQFKEALSLDHLELLEAIIDSGKCPVPVMYDSLIETDYISPAIFIKIASRMIHNVEEGIERDLAHACLNGDQAKIDQLMLPLSLKEKQVILSKHVTPFKLTPCGLAHTAGHATLVDRLQEAQKEMIFEVHFSDGTTESFPFSIQLFKTHLAVYDIDLSEDLVKEEYTGNPLIFKQMIQFIYSGALRITPENFIELASLADKYNFEHLKKRLSEWLKANAMYAYLSDIIEGAELSTEPPSADEVQLIEKTLRAEAISKEEILAAFQEGYYNAVRMMYRREDLLSQLNIHRHFEIIGERGDSVFASLMIRYGYNVHIRDLYYAVVFNTLDLFKMILSSHVQKNGISDLRVNGCNLLQTFIREDESDELTSFFIAFLLSEDRRLYHLNLAAPLINNDPNNFHIYSILQAALLFVRKLSVNKIIEILATYPPEERLKYLNQRSTLVFATIESNRSFFAPLLAAGADPFVTIDDFSPDVFKQVVRVPLKKTSAFRESVERGLSELVGQVLPRLANVPYQELKRYLLTEDDSEALALVIQSRCLGLVELFLNLLPKEEQIKLLTGEYRERSFLHFVCHKSSEEVTLFLFEQLMLLDPSGLSNYLMVKKDFTLLATAASSNFTALMRRIFYSICQWPEEKKKDYINYGPERLTALDLSLEADSLESFSLLLEEGADPFNRSDGSSFFQRAASFSKLPAIRKLLPLIAAKSADEQLDLFHCYDYQFRDFLFMGVYPESEPLEGDEKREEALVLRHKLTDILKNSISQAKDQAKALVTSVLFGFNDHMRELLSKIAHDKLDQILLKNFSWAGRFSFTCDPRVDQEKMNVLELSLEILRQLKKQAEENDWDVKDEASRQIEISRILTEADIHGVLSQTRAKWSAEELQELTNFSTLKTELTSQNDTTSTAVLGDKNAS